MMKCSNCSSTSLETLGSIDSINSMAVTSDAQLMGEFKAKRTLCKRCALVEIHYSPPDRLKKYFIHDYDLSDEVQDNLIVQNKKTMGKHGHIIESLFSALEDIGDNGSYLEIACGKGELIEYFQQKYPKWECTGIDPSLQAPEQDTEDTVPSGGARPNFIKGFFEESYFEAKKFDLIVAHGFLNRSPVLPELMKIRNLSRKGTLLSIEVCVFENSVFAPYIWDHPFNYKTAVFERYLKQAGFRTLSRTNCSSSYHFISVCDSDPQPMEDIRVDSSLVRETQSLYNDHLKWWEVVRDNHEKAVSARSVGERFALFGAGLFSAVLISLVGRAAPELVIDEIKSGSTFFEMPVVGLSEAACDKPPHVLLCSRPDYVESITEKLKERKIPFTVLTPEA